jgi:putative flippase GtrA
MCPYHCGAVLRDYYVKMKILKLESGTISRKDVTQFIKYFISGSTYFWSGYLVFAWGYGIMHWSWWPAKMLADFIGWTLNYLAQRYWAFNKSSLAHHDADIAKKYVILTIINFGLDYVIVGSLKSIGISPYIGLFISAGFFTIWNYAWYRLWVFWGKQSI